MAIFPGEPRLAGLTGAKDDGGGGDNWSYKMCKAPFKSSPATNQHQLFTGRMPSLSPNQQCQSTVVTQCRQHIHTKFKIYIEQLTNRAC